MSNIENYKQYFTKEYLMGPNSFRLLDELIRRKPENMDFGRALDLGCGYALTSMFIANETNAEQVFAFDLWIAASENYRRIQKNYLENKIIPIHGDALDMPFAQEYFDSVISVDAYHYFGCKEGVFAEKILPFVKKDGYVMIAVPGIKEEPQGEVKELFTAWAEGDDAELFKTVGWWESLLKKECQEQCEIVVKEAECFDIAWQEWFDTEHKFGIRDKEFLDKGLDKILNFVLIYVKKR
jgi:cyclopropane fatty-acyl-phospholipid synthase-like methyltransferase